MLQITITLAVAILGGLILVGVLAGLLAYWTGHRDGYLNACLVHRRQIAATNRHADAAWKEVAKHYPAAVNPDEPVPYTITLSPNHSTFQPSNHAQA